METFLMETPGRSFHATPRRPRGVSVAGNTSESKDALKKYTEFISALKFYGLLYQVPDLKEERKKRRSSLCLYLDSFSRMADYEKAGKTHTSLAIQNDSGFPVYWVAANNVVNDKTISHLTEILQLLQSLQQKTTQTEIDLIRATIAEKSVRFCRKKVKNYIKRLCNSVQAILEDLESSAKSIDEDLEQLLDTWEAPPDDILELCENAREYAMSSVVRRLAAEYPDSTSQSPWFQVHHYIRRLGSWHKAARILVSFARGRQGFVLRATIKPITQMTVMQPTATKPSIQSVIGSAMPDLDPQMALIKLEKLRQNASGTLTEQYENSMASPGFAHSECVLAEFFYQNNFEFFDNVRSIGGSKPSCYACSSFFHFHPGNFIPRPRHGNVYSKWLWPLFEQPRHDHILETVEDMVRDVRDAIRSRSLSDAIWQDETFCEGGTVLSKLAGKP